MIEEKIKKIVTNCLRSPRNISKNTNLINVGLDSLSFVKIIVSIEDLFGIEFPDTKLIISEANTINKLTKIVKKIVYKEK